MPTPFFCKLDPSPLLCVLASSSDLCVDFSSDLARGRRNSVDREREIKAEENFVSVSFTAGGDRSGVLYENNSSRELSLALISGVLEPDEVEAFSFSSSATGVAVLEDPLESVRFRAPMVAASRAALVCR